MTSDGCSIIEVAHSVKARNVFIDLDDLGDWIKHQPDVDLYSSLFRYYIDDPNIGGVLAGFGLDFDDAEKPERARKEALATVKFLIDFYDVKEKDISVCFSGNKGFHVFVNHAVLNVEPHVFLPQIFKSMARELTQKHGLKTLDLQIYDRRRLIRLPNTRHQKSGLYKIPLTVSELQTLNIDQIRALAVKPREHVAGRVEHEKSEKASAWLRQHTDTYVRALENKKPEFATSDFKTQAVLPCVKKRLELGAEEGLRNRCTWQLASYFCKKGTSLEDCLSLMKEWHGRIEKGLEPYTWEESQDTIKAVYEKGGYGIGCGSEYAEGLCPGKENCSLFVKVETTEIPEEAYQEAEKILQQDPLEFIADTVNLIHVGDRDLIKIAYITALSAQLAKPIHLWPIGTSQKGKSHVLYNIKNVLPREHYEVFTSASPKSLFYFAKKYGEDIFNGKLIYIDEIESSKLTLPLLRTLTSPTDIEPRHLSVYDADLLDLKIKGQRIVWFTSVKPFGAEQLRNRFIFVNPDESTKQDDKVLAFQKQGLQETKLLDREEFKTAQAATKKILSETKTLSVRIPYLEAIQWPYKERRWLFPNFINFINVITKIRYKQRRRTETEIFASREDFETAKQLWTTFIGHILYRASTPAKKILDKLPENIKEAKTLAELSEETGFTTQYIGRFISELSESELISTQKRQGEGRGHSAWEYWKKPLPPISKVRLKGSAGLEMSPNVPPTDLEKRQSGFLEPLPPNAPAEKCELCGQQAVEYAVHLDSSEQPLRRCSNCVKTMQDKGLHFKLTPVEVNG